MIPIKTEAEIDSMRRSGQAVAAIRETLREKITPGVTTGEVDDYAGELIEKTGGRSAFLNYRGFPGNICISVNEEVVHGIGGRKKIAYGDLVKIDVGLILDGWVGDTAISIPVGAVSPEVEHLMTATEESLYAGIAQARAGRRLGDICSAIEKHVLKNDLSIVRDFVGHGVGRKLHEEPQIPNYGKPGTGPKLKPGMTFAIEPMVNMGRGEVRMLSDGWTVVTIDRKPSSHFEHTVLITDDEPEILTCSKKAESSR